MAHLGTKLVNIAVQEHIATCPTCSRHSVELNVMQDDGTVKVQLFCIYGQMCFRGRELAEQYLDSVYVKGQA